MGERTPPGRGRGPTRAVLPHARPGPNEAVNREIRHHIEERIERLIEQGLTPEEARTEAERRFGDVERVRDEVRAIDRSAAPWRNLVALVDKTARDLRYGVRSAVRSPWLALTIVVTLALGIGANTAIFSLVEAVLLRPLPFPEPERVAYVAEVAPQGGPFAVAPANFLDWRERQGSFEAMGVIAGGTGLVTEGGPAERVAGVRVSADYFRALGVEPALGRVFTAEEEGPGGPNLVVVSQDFWVSRLAGDPDVIGRSVRLDGATYTVIGVMPEGLRAYQRWYSVDPIMLWRPDPFVADAPQERRAKRLTVLARLRPDVTMESAQAEMDALAAGLAAEHPETNAEWGAVVLPISRAMTETARTPLLVLFGAVGFILLIACLNAGSLLLARADARRSAVTVRRALGAGRSDIVRQLLAESLVLSLGAAVLGVVLARALLPILGASSPVNLTRLGDIQINGSVLVFTLTLAVATAVLAGLAPALGVSAPDLSQELKDRGLGRTESRRTRRGRSALVVAEVALSVVLVIGAGLMLGSYLRVSGLELGFESEDVVRVGALLPRAGYATMAGRGSHPATENFTLWRPRPEETELMEGVEAALARLPGVQSVAAGNFDPLPGLMWGSLARPEDVPAAAPGEELWLAFRPVSPGWFETLHMPIVAGRALTEADRFGTEDVVVLDEEAVARLWPGEPAGSALGRRVMMQDGIEDVERPFRVVGVSGATRQTIFDNSGEEVVEGMTGVAHVPYRSQAEAYVDWQIGFRMRSVFLVRTGRELADITPEIRTVLEAFAPELPVTIERLEDTVASPLSSRRFYVAMLVAFGSLALVLAATGVFAVMAYTVTRKTRELGIRLALGARAAELERAELLRGVKLALLGLVIGAIGAAWLARFIAAFLYGVGTVDPVTYGAVALLVVIVVLAASYLPARRAAMIDPMESLRTE